MSKIKEILCMHHSHLDVGYTHPQPMLLELQCDYIEQAIDLCLKTSDWPEESRFRWTCEATYPLMKWFESASPKRVKLFRKFVEEGRISVTALPMHTTPDCTSMQWTQALQDLDIIRKLSGSKITTAINHDVNGQPWTISSLMLDSNIQFYMTGINIHFGGIPFERPYAFRWETPDGRSLPSFVGEHYSLFSQFFFTYENDTKKMHQGVQEYINRIEKSNWKEDFVVLTATNPPLYDNNCPDANLADLIRRYNEEGHEQVIRFVTPEMIYERICRKGIDNLPKHAGDWTDYWSFGCASTARELKINRRAKNLLYKADFLECVADAKPSERYKSVQENAYKNALLFDEHTWGAAESITKPDQEETYAQEIHKKEFAYAAADSAAYLLSCQMEDAAANPIQADEQEGLLIVNPTGFTVQQELTIPSYMTQHGRTLAALRAKEYLPYAKENPDSISFGTIEVPPFTMRRIPFSRLENQAGKQAKGCRISDTEIITPYYHITLQPDNGRVLQIKDTRTGRSLIDQKSKWGFFDLIEERIDPRFASLSRKAIFPRDVDKGNKNISQWQHGWKAKYESISAFLDWSIEQTGDKVTIVYHSRAKEIPWLEQRISFSSVHSRILLDACFTKEKEEEPHSIYFAFPLSLQDGWSCVYDTADTFVRADEEQLGSVCRDYFMIDKSISVYDEAGGVTLACPDAPMVQIGGFQFGRENKHIKREKNPLLLAWTMNNYWDTNFAVSQEGKMSFHYEISSFDKFCKKDAYKAGMLATSPCAVGAAISCKRENNKELFHCESMTCTPIFFRPQMNAKGWLVAVKNHSDNEGVSVLSVPGKQILYSAITDIQGNLRQELKVIDNMVKLEQAPNSIVFLQIVIE